MILHKSLNSFWFSISFGAFQPSVQIFYRFKRNWLSIWNYLFRWHFWRFFSFFHLVAKRQCEQNHIDWSDVSDDLVAFSNVPLLSIRRNGNRFIRRLERHHLPVRLVYIPIRNSTNAIDSIAEYPTRCCYQRIWKYAVHTRNF